MRHTIARPRTPTIDPTSLVSLDAVTGGRTIESVIACMIRDVVHIIHGDGLSQDSLRQRLLLLDV